MTGKSAAELEREAEAARAGIIQTAEALQNRMTPGRMMNDINDYFRHSDGAKALENMKTQVRDNPLPLALVGTGIAWLIMGGGTKSHADTAGTHPRGGLSSDEVWNGAPGTTASHRSTGLSGTGDKSSKDSTGGAMHSATSKASSAYESASSRVSSAAGSASDTASHAGERVSDAARNASAQARHAGSRVQRMFSDTLKQEPLIIGALGLAVGAAIAAMLPRTRVEEEYVGPYADKAQESAKEAVNRGTESAKNVANEAYRAGEREAEKQTHKQTGSASSSSGSSTGSSSGSSTGSSSGSSTGSSTSTSSGPGAVTPPKPAGSASDRVAPASPASKGPEKKS